MNMSIYTFNKKLLSDINNIFKNNFKFTLVTNQ